VRLVLKTNISTIDFEPERKLSVYRDLLSVSRMALVKFYLYGDNHNVGVAVDLDLKSLSHDEFTDAIAMLLAGYLYLKSMSGFKELLEAEEVKTLAKLVVAHLSRGESREEVITYLVRSGFSEDEARRIVAAIEEAAGIRREGEESRGDTLFI
jgi:hypothetical protein